MAKIISFANQKGGVGKTTSAVNVAASLGILGFKTLLIDLDPQGNATSGVGVPKKSLKGTIKEVLTGEMNIKDVVLTTEYENTSIIPTNVSLSGAEFDLYNDEGSEYNLKDALKELTNDYDYILIDCPPSLNMLTINAMTTADSVLVPIQCEYYALEGLSQLIHTIDLVQQRLNPNLKIDGVVFTMYDVRTNLSVQVVENVRSNLDAKIYDTLIPRNIRLAEAPSHGVPINMYDTRSAGTESYRALAKEVIERKDI